MTPIVNVSDVPATPAKCVDVFIVGGGPVGLLSASLLRQAALSVRIVDVEFQPNHWGRGDWIHGRTLELLERAGLHQELLDTGAHVDNVQAYKNGKIVHTYPFVPETVDSKYPFLLCVGQHITEAMLQTQLSDQDVQVERPCTVTKVVEATAVEKDGDNERGMYPLTLTVLNMRESTSETVHCKYLFGCDGAHSAIRKMVGIEYQGDTTEIHGGVLDALIRSNFPGRKQVSFLQSDVARTVSMFPRENGLARIFVHFDENELAMRKEQFNRNTIQVEDIQREAKRALMPYRLEILGTMYWSTYVVGQRLASDMQAMNSRVFLLGDAAHSQSPTLGQGLNTGFGDVFNLVWKLALVEKMVLDADVLATFSLERRSVAQQVIDIDKEVAGAAANSACTDKYCELIDQHRLFTCGFGIRYAHGPGSVNNQLLQNANSSLVGSCAPNAKVIHAATGKKVRLFDGVNLFTFTVLFLVHEMSADTLAPMRHIIKWCESDTTQHKMGSAPHFAIITTSTKDQVHACLADEPDKTVLLEKIRLDKLNQSQCHRGYAQASASSAKHVYAPILVLVRPDGYIASTYQDISCPTTAADQFLDQCGRHSSS